MNLTDIFAWVRPLNHKVLLVCIYLHWSSIETLVVNRDYRPQFLRKPCFVYAFQATDEQMDRPVARSRSRCRERRLNKHLQAKLIWSIFRRRASCRTLGSSKWNSCWHNWTIRMLLVLNNFINNPLMTKSNEFNWYFCMGKTSKP